LLAKLYDSADRNVVIRNVTFDEELRGEDIPRGLKHLPKKVRIKEVFVERVATGFVGASIELENNNRYWAGFSDDYGANFNIEGSYSDVNDHHIYETKILKGAYPESLRTEIKGGEILSLRLTLPIIRREKKTKEGWLVDEVGTQTLCLLSGEVASD